MDRTTGMYTLGHEKTCHYISDYNSHVYLWIFLHFYQWKEEGML